MLLGAGLVVTTLGAPEGAFISGMNPASALNTSSTIRYDFDTCLYSQLLPLRAVRQPHTGQGYTIFLPLMRSLALRTGSIFLLEADHPLSPGLHLIIVQSIDLF